MRSRNIHVGLLYSLSGTTSVTEKPQYETALAAIEQVNKQGGIRGIQIIPVVEDIQSDPYTAARKAEKLCQRREIWILVGTYTSACRKAILPVLEKYNMMLLYPTTNEGLEAHPNVFYCGPTLNQQANHLIPWMLKNLGNRVFLIGSDYLYPRETNRQLKKMIQARGGSICRDVLLPLGTSEMYRILKEIDETSPDIILSTIVGDSIIAFYQQFSDFGFRADKIPIVSLVTSETEIQSMGVEYAVGHYSSYPYFQSIDREENKRFVEIVQHRFGKNSVINCVMESTYNAIHLLSGALEKVSAREDLKHALLDQEFEAPQGKIFFEKENQHIWQWPKIGRVNKNGQFDIVWSVDNPIPPDPWHAYTGDDLFLDNVGVLQKQIIDFISDRLPDGIIVLDQDGDIFYMNSVANQLVGHIGYDWSITHNNQYITEEENTSWNYLPRYRNLRYQIQRIYRGKTIVGSLIYLREEKAGSVSVNSTSYSENTNRSARAIQGDINTDKVALIGQSEVFLEQVKIAQLAAQTSENVLLLGESGTGKEVFARAIHELSDRRNRSFIVVNCGALPADLIATELFGYVEGAFTGAKKGGKVGAFEAAEDGTIFLDEIGELPIQLQSTLLRAIENKAISRVGSTRVIPIKARIIAATNKNLKQEIAYSGMFRSDLYYRLNVISINIPPLRDRREDIPLLADHFLRVINQLYTDGPDKRFDSSVYDLFMMYRWPGNVRELRNIVQRAYILSGPETIIFPRHLPEEITRGVLHHQHSSEITSSTVSLHDTAQDAVKTKKEQERTYILEVLRTVNGNVRLACRMLGISRSTLYRKITASEIAEIRNVK